MDDSNRKTIAAYESLPGNFVKDTQEKTGDLGENWVNKSIEGLPDTAKILEIGAGYGRDARYIGDRGFHVEMTDAAKTFVDILQDQDPTAHQLDILTDDLDTEYDLVLANAVLLHLDKGEGETEFAIRKVFDALKPGGRFAFTLQQGEGYKWKENKGMGPRFFQYWSKEEIVDLLTAIGFSNVDAWTDAPDSRDVTWIKIIATK